MFSAKLDKVIKRYSKKCYFCGAMVKQNVIKCLSAFVALLYLLCVTGFNVHSCAESGECFVAPLLEGATCHDFHPDHHCHSSCCSAGHHDGTHVCCGETAMSGRDCCSDDIFQLSVTGAGRSDSGHSHHNHCKCLCGHCPLSIELGSEAGSFMDPVDSVPLHEVPLPGLRCSRSLLSIWRL